MITTRSLNPTNQWEASSSHIYPHWSGKFSLDLGCEITHWRWKFRLRNTSRLLLKRLDSICMSSSSSLFCAFQSGSESPWGNFPTPPPTSPHRSAKLISFHPELQKHQRHLLIAGSDYCYYIKITQSH